MRKLTTTVALLAAMASYSTAALAATSAQPQSSQVTTTVSATAITYSFTGLSFAGFQFLQVAGDLAGPVYGTLTGVSVNATLDASSNDTYGDDLTLYVDLLPLSAGGLLQVGGYSNLGAAERQSWASGGSADPGTAVVGSITLATPIAFSDTGSSPAIWLGNGYGDPSAQGTWSGSITLTGLSATAAAVPEPASALLMALGGLGVVGWVGRRRRPT